MEVAWKGEDEIGPEGGIDEDERAAGCCQRRVETVDSAGAQIEIG